MWGANQLATRNKPLFDRNLLLERYSHRDSVGQKATRSAG
jgi:hypothetical protein